MNGKKGFTMIEVLLVAVIIAVLVSIAVPNYIQATERGRAREAIATLNAIVAAERTYNSERRLFLPLDNGGNVANWAAIGMDNPNSNAQRSFNYGLAVGGGGSTFVATATRIGPVNAGETISITDDGTLNTAGFTP